MMDTTVIIGTGLAGYTLARELRKRDPQLPIHLITSDDGHSYSKPMLSNAFSKAKDADALIMASAEKMATDLAAEIWTDTQVSQIETNKQQIHSTRGIVEYHRLVLAHGASPIKIPFEGDAADQILSVNSLQDYRVFRQAQVPNKRVLIIGAGLIGCEFANDLSTVSSRIDIVDLAPQALGRLLPPQAAQQLQERLQAGGIHWHLDNSVSRVSRSGSSLLVDLKHGEPIETDIVLSAIGLRANIKIAADAGIETDRGIKVDRYLQTSDNNVFALGDCAQVEDLHLPFVMPLMNAARALAATLSGERTQVKYPAMPVVVKTPIYPIVVCPPPRRIEGSWHEEVEENGIRARFRDEQGNVCGFVLTDGLVKERIAMAKEIPDWLS